MDDIRIHGFAGSTYVQTARLVSEEKTIRYALAPLEFRSESHRALHPFLRMPVLTHGKLRLFETLAICVYLDGNFPGPRLVPEALENRCLTLQWISAANDYMYGALVRGLVKAETPSEDALTAARQVLEVVDAELSRRDYLGADQITLADLFVAPMVGFALSKPRAAELVRQYAAIVKWHERMSRRKSFARISA